MWRDMTIEQLDAYSMGVWSPTTRHNGTTWQWWDEAASMFEAVGFVLITVRDEHVLPPIYD